MKKYSFAICLIAISVAFVTCNNHKKTVTIDPDCIRIKVEPTISDQIILSEMIESVRFIPLESDSNALMGEIYKIAYDNGLYFCQERDSYKIYSFDSEGRFLTQIGKKGHGHGEYLYPGEFTLNKENQEVWLIDNAIQLKKYTYSGSYIETIDMGRIFMHDFCVANSIWYCYTEKRNNSKNDNSGEYWGYELTVLHKTGHIERYFPINKELYPKENRLTIIEPTPFSELNNSITFHHTVSDVIYSIDEKTSKISSKYVVDFGEKKYKRDISQMKTRDMLNYLYENPDQAGFINNVIESEDFLHFRFEFANRINRAFYDKKTKLIKSGTPVNDIFTTAITYIGQRDNRIIGCINDPMTIIFTDKAHAFVSPETIKELKQLDSQSNPVLVELEFKSFK